MVPVNSSLFSLGVQRLLHFGADLFGLLVERLAALGQRQAAGGAVQQPGAQRFFQPPDAFTDHRAGDAGALRGLAERAAVDNQGEQNQVIGVFVSGEHNRLFPSAERGVSVSLSFQ